MYQNDTYGNLRYVDIDDFSDGTIDIGNGARYSYTDPTWLDRLTAFNGVPITYDDAGNPLSYYNGSAYTLTWQNGRELATATKGGVTSSYKYNIDGQRVQKTVGNVVYDYYYADGLLVRQTWGNNYIDFIYDESGIFSFVYNGVQYYYIKNLQSDIVAIANADGTILVEYVYDAWGDILSITGTESSTIGEINPIRYRGYYFDTDTEFYYLNSRYYDPEIRRFINADDATLIGASADFSSCNLYAYCFNNPVNYYDDSGELPSWAVKVIIGTAVIAAAAVLTVATAGTGTALACFAVGALKGAAVGAAIGAASGAATGAVSHRITTGSWEGAGQAALEGAADGYMTGAITGFVSGGLSSNACFIAGTSVLTSAGYVAIETIQAGDNVYAHNPETGETAIKTVVQTFVNETNELVHITVNGEKIICTNEHPFYVPMKGWTAACQLRAGDRLQLVNGDYVVVEQVQHEILESPIAVYNFEVEDFHAYYVGEQSVLVHNMCGGLKSGKPSVPKGSTRIRSDVRNVNSQEFKDFIRSMGKTFRSSEWKYRMETWVTVSGEYIERHYWYNKVTGESFFHL